MDAGQGDRHRDRTGSIEPGKTADLVVLDGDLEVTGVMAAGRWVPRQAPPARVGPVRNTTSPGGR